ncbi:MAG: hypothetical protein EOP04_01725 [Proteobacteria bacterium]|nr:MAG: hypothetical protein EOP04_01725 [Pseudomonadota bacterium]
MKALNLIGHPVTLAASFLLLLISGQAFGGPYLVYLIMGLPHGAAYAVSGVGAVLVAFLAARARKQAWIATLLHFISILAMTLSLYLFFSGERLQYNRATFTQTIPVVTLGLFALCVLTSLARSLVVVSRMYDRYRRDDGTLTPLG